MKNFTYYVPTKIHFGKGMISHLSELAESGSRVLLVYGGGSIKRMGIYEKAMQILTEVGIGEEKLELMAENCAPKLGGAFVPLTKEDVLEIFRACL